MMLKTPKKKGGKRKKDRTCEDDDEDVQKGAAAEPENGTRSRRSPAFHAYATV